MSPVASLVAVLAALTVAAAYPTKDEEAYYYNRLNDLPDNQKTRNLDGIDAKEEPWPVFVEKPDQDGDADKGGGNLLRGLDLLRDRAAYLSRAGEDGRRYHYMGGLKRAAGTCCDVFSGVGIGNEKRNMDEIDRSSFNSFVKKNFDEIDRSGFGSFVKKNFDEIDRSGFGSFVKRSAPSSNTEHPHN